MSSQETLQDKNYFYQKYIRKNLLNGINDLNETNNTKIIINRQSNDQLLQFDSSSNINYNNPDKDTEINQSNIELKQSNSDHYSLETIPFDSCANYSSPKSGSTKISKSNNNSSISSDNSPNLNFKSLSDKINGLELSSIDHIEEFKTRSLPINKLFPKDRNKVDSGLIIDNCIKLFEDVITFAGDWLKVLHTANSRKDFLKNDSIQYLIYRLQNSFQDFSEISKNHLKFNVNKKIQKNLNNQYDSSKFKESNKEKRIVNIKTKNKDNQSIEWELKLRDNKAIPSVFSKKQLYSEEELNLRNELLQYKDLYKREKGKFLSAWDKLQKYDNQFIEMHDEMIKAHKNTDKQKMDVIKVLSDKIGSQNRLLKDMSMNMMILKNISGI